MPIYLKTDQGFRSMVSAFLKTSEGWRKVVKAYLKTSDGWRKLFESSLSPSISSPVTISKSTNSTTKLITLTGTNYPWTNSTGLTYEFNRSVPATFDATLDTGIITNPTVSNTKTYLLVDTDILPNQTNTFTFKVIATNSTYSTTSSSEASTAIEGVRNITDLVNDAKTYSSLNFTWLGGAYSSSYIYQYQTYAGEVEGAWSSQVTTTNNFVFITELSANSTYRIRVKGITGTTTANPGYSGNWTYQTATTEMSPNPQQLTAPTITGTGYAFYEINGLSGTYESGTYINKTSYIGKTILSTSPTSGTTEEMPIAGSAPYKVTQYDVSTPKYYFYYVDAVTANDGSTVYYYYSPAIEGKVGLIEDDYTRTVSNGLGVMTPSINNFMTPNSYIYNLSSNGSLWSVNGSVASIASAVSSSNPYSYPQQSVELGGKTNAKVSVSFPAGSDGLGLTFWSTSAGSWWASRVNRTASTVNKYVYYTLSTVCNTVGTVNDNYCSTGTETIYVCTPGAGTYSNNCGVVTTCPENGIGDQVNKCRTRSSSSCPDNSSGSSGSYCKTRLVYSCPQNGSGNSSSNCRVRSVQSCPNNGIGSTSSNCKTRAVTTCPANGSGSPGSYCNIRTSNSCPDNGTGSASNNCKSRSVTTQTCPNNGIGSTSSNCKTRTVTTYSCPNGYSLIGTNCYQNSFPYAVTQATATNTTVYDNFVTTSSTVYDSSVTTNVYDYQSASTVYDNYQTDTYYDSTVSSTVYDSTVTNIIYDGNVDTYSGNVATTNTIYYIYGCTVGPVTQYGGTLPTNCSNTTSSTTVYATNLDIINADGSIASVVNTENIYLNEESPSVIGGMSVETSGNTISTTIYSDLGRLSAITTKNYTPSNPNKVSVTGASSFGIIKTPPGSSGGTQFDNFKIE